MGLESQSAINPRHKSRPIKAVQPSIAWIKFITPSSSFGPSLECPVLKSAQISWISPLSASLIFLDLALVIGPTGTCNGSLNALWFSSKPLPRNLLSVNDTKSITSKIEMYLRHSRNSIRKWWLLWRDRWTLSLLRPHLGSSSHKLNIGAWYLNPEVLVKCPHGRRSPQLLGERKWVLYLNHVNPILAVDSTSDPYVFSSLW